MAKSPTYEPSAGSPLKRVWFGVILFYLLVLALNGAQLDQNNSQLPYGGIRDFWMTISAPIAKVCKAAHLDAPRNWLEKHGGSALNR